MLGVALQWLDADFSLVMVDLHGKTYVCPSSSAHSTEIKSGMEAIHLLFSNQLATHLSNQIGVVEYKSPRKEICR